MHLPGTPATMRDFAAELSRQAGKTVRPLPVPEWVLSLAAKFDATARGAHDIRHLLTHPVMLDGALAERTLGAIPRTALTEGIAQTWAWHRERPELRLQG